MQYKYRKSEVYKAQNELCPRHYACRGRLPVRVLAAGSEPAVMRDAGTRLGVEPAVDPVGQSHPIRRLFALPAQYQRYCADGNDDHSHEIPLSRLDDYYGNTM